MLHCFELVTAVCTAEMPSVVCFWVKPGSRASAFTLGHSRELPDGFTKSLKDTSATPWTELQLEFLGHQNFWNNSPQEKGFSSRETVFVKQIRCWETWDSGKAFLPSCISRAVSWGWWNPTQSALKCGCRSKTLLHLTAPVLALALYAN